MSAIESMKGLLDYFLGLSGPEVRPQPTVPTVSLRPSPEAHQTPVIFQPRYKAEILTVYNELGKLALLEIAAKIIEEAEFYDTQHEFCTGSQQYPADSTPENPTCPYFFTNCNIRILASDLIDGSVLYPLRRIVVQTVSKDQGWSSYPRDWLTHDNSWTWFEITLERRDEENGPDREWKEIVRQKLWSNVHASRSMMTHAMSFERGEEIVNKAKKGDRLCIWACAKYPGWRGEIDRVDLWTFSSVH